MVLTRLNKLFFVEHGKRVMTDHHKHDHSGGHHHHHVAPNKQGRIFAIAIVLNMVFVVIEFSYGFIANSTALAADAGHNISDVLSLLLAWSAVILTRKQPSQRYTYGLRSTSILAALANAMLLLVASGAIAWEAIHRFSQAANGRQSNCISCGSSWHCRQWPVSMAFHERQQKGFEHSRRLPPYGGGYRRIACRRDCWSGYFLHRLVLAGSCH